MQTNEEERCHTVAVLSDLLLAIVYFAVTNVLVRIVTKLVTLNAISVLCSSIYTTLKTVPKQIRRSASVILYSLFVR